MPVETEGPSHEPRAADPGARRATYAAIRRTVTMDHYLTDPSREPDPAKWEVDVAYLTRGT
jgi:hypothetical protein